MSKSEFRPDNEPERGEPHRGEIHPMDVVDDAPRSRFDRIVDGVYSTSIILGGSGLATTVGVEIARGSSLLVKGVTIAGGIASHAGLTWARTSDVMRRRFPEYIQKGANKFTELLSVEADAGNVLVEEERDKGKKRAELEDIWRLPAKENPKDPPDSKGKK